MLESSGTRWHLHPDEAGILPGRQQTVAPHTQHPRDPYGLCFFIFLFWEISRSVMKHTIHKWGGIIFTISG